MLRASVVAACVIAASASVSAEILQQILVKVNGEIVTKTDFEQRQVSALRQRNQQFANDEEVRKAIVEVTPALILEAIDELLIIQRGRELGYRMTDENFTRILGQIRTENKIESDEQFEAALKQEGMTLADLRKSLERQMLVSQVQQQEVLGKIAVTEAESQAYYKEHQQEFTTTPSVTVREILVAVAPTKDAAGNLSVNVGADDDAKAKAEALRARAVAGEDFGQMAGAESESPSKANGGLIGPISPAELSAELAQLLQTMKVGQVSAPIRSSRGYQIFKLESSTPAVTESFDQAREKISDRVADGKRRVEFLKYVDRLRAQAIIEWKNDELEKAYQQALTDRSTTAQ